MRLGMPPGVTSTTEVYLPFPELDGRAAPVDYSANARTVSLVGSGLNPLWAPGPFGDAREFGTGYKHYSLTGISFAASLTLEAWIYSTDGSTVRPIIVARAKSGSEKSCYALQASNTQVYFTVYNSAGSWDILTLPVAHALSTSGGRWFHVRAVYDQANLKMYIFVDGQLAAFKVTTIAALPTTDLPTIEVGGEASTVETSKFYGRLAHVRILSSAETTTDGLSPCIRAERITRRSYDIRHIDLREHLQADTWTNDASGGFHLAFSELTLGDFIVAPEDVLSVKAKTTSATTTFAQVGNVTDLDAASNSYFVDMVNSRMYSSEDPTGYTVFEVSVRVPLADAGIVRGTRYYRGAVLPSSAGERMTSFYGDAPPTGGGGTLTIAAAHADLTGTLVREESSDVAWRGSPVYSYAMHDATPWSAATATLIGFAEEPPDDNKDTLSLKVSYEMARLYKVPMQGQTANRTDWPYLEERSEGYAWPVITGLSHRKIPCVRVDTRLTDLSGASGYRYKFCAHKVARLAGLWIGGSYWVGAAVHNVDLSVGEFWLQVIPEDTTIEADVDGYGTAGTPTSSLNQSLPFGSSSDCLTTPEDILSEAYLQGFLEVPSAQIGSSFAATGARVQRGLRRAESMATAGAAVAIVGKHLNETLTSLYHSTASADYEWEDVVKADAIQYTVRDVDVVEESWIFDRAKLVKRVNASGLAYLQDTQGRVTAEESTYLTLKSDIRYDIKEVLNMGLTGMYNAATVDTYLGVARAFMETPLTFYVATLTARLQAAEIFDVIDLQVSSRPNGVGNRFRILGVEVLPGERVKVTLFSETPFPSDGTSAFGSRAAFSPSRRLTFSDGAGQALADTAGAWATVGSHREPFQGGLLIPSGAGHRMQVRAVRSGGTDVQFRIRDLTNSQTIASITGVSTSLGFQTATTSFANVPTSDAQIRLEYATTGGATGTIHSAGWEHEEVTPSLSAPLSPTTLWSWGDDAGVGVTAPGSFTAIGRCGLISNIGLFAGARLRFVVHFDPGTATGIRFSILSTSTPWFTATTFFDTGVVSASPATTETLSNPILRLTPFKLTAICASGSFTVHSASIDLVNPDPRRFGVVLANWGADGADSTSLANTADVWTSLDGHEQVRQHAIDLVNDASVRWYLGVCSAPLPGRTIAFRLRDETAGATLLAGNTAANYGTGPYYAAASLAPIAGLSAADWRMRLEYKSTGGTVDWYSCCVQVVKV